MYNHKKTIQFTFSFINEMINRNDIDLKTRLKEDYIDKNWSNIQKSQLIESIILGFPIPIIYLSEKINGEIYVIDGIERLKAINEFKNNKFPLEGLELLKECEGKWYRDEDKESIDTKYYRILNMSNIECFIIYAPTLETEMALYKRIKQE